MEIYGMTGERLGTIGEIRKPASQGEAAFTDLPQWKKDFLVKPSVSVRKGFAWGYSTPFEDTSAIVLTSGSSSFVDIRFPLQVDTKESIASHPAFWAFSGTSSTSFLPEASEVSMPFFAHSVWKHDIDTKGPHVSDEGDLFLLPNGDCIEVGMMRNPSTGATEMYKEYWTTPETEVGGAESKKLPCSVARIVHDSGETSKSLNQGIIIRIGGYCQGILQNNSHDGRILVERWMANPVEHNPALSDTQANSRKWSKDTRSNTEGGDKEVEIPCMWVCTDTRRLEDSVMIQNNKWQIVEASV